MVRVFCRVKRGVKKHLQGTADTLTVVPPGKEMTSHRRGFVAGMLLDVICSRVQARRGSRERHRDTRRRERDCGEELDEHIDCG